MNIVTLTLCPAFDIHCQTEKFVAYKENSVMISSRMAGGKGVNISRALQAVGVPNTPVILLGEENGREFAYAVAALSPQLLWTPGRIRENITLHSDDGRETRISFAGFAVSHAVLQPLEEMLLSLLSCDSILTLTGRLPEGITPQDMLPLLTRLREMGVRLVIDSNSYSMQDLRQIRPWLMKPNEQEAAHYFGDSVEECVSALIRDGIENVMLSKGPRGATLYSAEGRYDCPAPQIEVRSTIGAGDSSIAGFISAIYKGKNKAEALHQAVAFGSAACLGEGTLPPTAEDIQKFL